MGLLINFVTKGEQEMNLHDLAHQLARAIRQSSEYKGMLAAKDDIKDNPAAQEMIKDFHRKQFAVQAAQLSGEDVPADKIKQLNSLYEILAANPGVRTYLEAEYNLSRLLADIQKIISEAVEPALE
jgi:cell fate (sporulation/competence/biofilm development) regulator YlbF (YheA/YmcA/DUF963 family)